MEKIYTESDLIIPALKIIAEQTSGIITTELISRLRAELNPTGEDLKQLKGRNDDAFSQKVRNLISHKKILKYVNISDERMFINELGLTFIADNTEDEYSPYIEQNENFCFPFIHFTPHKISHPLHTNPFALKGTHHQ